MAANKIQVTLLVRTAAQTMQKRLQKEIPETGDFEKYGVSYRLLKTPYEICLAVEPDSANPDNRRLTTNVWHTGDDRVVTNYIAKGSSKELVQKLKDSNTLSEITDSFLHLLERAENLND